MTLCLATAHLRPEESYVGCEQMRPKYKVLGTYLRMIFFCTFDFQQV